MPITMNIFNRQTYPTTNFSLVTKKEIQDGKNISRNTNCNTPFRMPLNQNRKTLPCPKPGLSCGENTNVLKDTKTQNEEISKDNLANVTKKDNEDEKVQEPQI